MPPMSCGRRLRRSPVRSRSCRSGAKDDDHQRERFLAHIEQQSQRLQRLVQSLLLLARVQTLREEVDREPIPVQALLETVASFGPEGRVRVETPQADAVVLANRDLVEQALLNLLSNAAKYAPESEIVLSGHADNGLVVLEVADSGPGMTDEEQARAADRFYRGRDSADGFGLGLSIARRALEAVGGRISIESTVGVGHDRAHLAAARAAGGDVSYRVPVVDDEPAIGDAVSYALASDGFAVDVRADGIEALEPSGDAPTSSSSTRLPRLSGTEVCRRLRAQRAVPIMMLTARDSRGRPCASASRSAPTTT